MDLPGVGLDPGLWKHVVAECLAALVGVNQTCQPGRGECRMPELPGQPVVEGDLPVSIHGGEGEVGVTRRTGCLNR